MQTGRITTLIDCCVCQSFFEVQEKNRLEQKGVLKRFSINCYGHQETVEEMRAEKTEMFEKLKDKRGTKEYEEWFMKYRPGESSLSKPTKKKATKKMKKKKVTKKKTQKLNKTTKTRGKTLKENKIKCSYLLDNNYEQYVI